MVTMLVVILHDLDRFPALLDAWRRIGVPGVTILPSVGGFQAETWLRRGGLGGLFSLFDQNKPQQRTIISLIDDPEILELAISEADRVVRGFDSPHSGILFAMPIDRAMGLKKWTPKEREREKQVEKREPDRGKENLLKWFREDVKTRYGKDVLQDWHSVRSTQVSGVMKSLGVQPIQVRLDTPLVGVLAAFQENPGVSLACVVNQEKRLMGIIPVSTLGEALMVPVMPEAFIGDPQGYQWALQYADAQKGYFAADIMLDPVFVQLVDPLEVAFLKMKRHSLAGIPVVDRHYRVKGFISLVTLLAKCYSDLEA